MPQPVAMRVSSLVAGVFGGLALWPVAGTAAPGVLRAADVHITMRSPVECDVDAGVTVDDAAEVEHRIEVLEGATVTLVDTPGAIVVAGPEPIGRTRAVSVRPAGPQYRLRYQVQQPPEAAFRCPVWLPTTPADGRSRTVRVRATLPEGAAPGGTMPAFSWSGRDGQVMLGHLPAFVRLSYSAEGVAAPMDVSRLMDGVSIGVLALASALWLRRRRA